MYLHFNLNLPKWQTHREMGTQSHGSADQEVDRQTAEVLFASAVFNYGGLERRNTSEEPFALSCIILK
jgi:hypothetical protein